MVDPIHAEKALIEIDVELMHTLLEAVETAISVARQFERAEPAREQFFNLQKTKYIHASKQLRQLWMEAVTNDDDVEGEFLGELADWCS